MLNFFTLDNNKNVVLDNENLKHFKEFRILLSGKYNKTDDDVIGIKKQKARLFFTYIYLVHDIRSPYISLDEEEREKTVCLSLYKTEKIKLLIDEKNAINKFKELQITMYPEIKVIKALKESMEIAFNLVTTTNKNMNKLIQKISYIENDLNNEELSNPNSVVLQNIEQITTKIKADLSYILPFIKQIDEANKKLKETEKLLVENSNAVSSIGRGNQTIGNRADPK